MTHLRWGLIGTGGIAHAFASDLRGNGFPITGVGSRTDASARAFADRFDIPNAHGSYEALAADPEVDAVYISTPHPFHASAAELALRGGKHVLVEKPFTLNAPEARRVVDLAAERGLVALEAMWTRFLPTMRRLHEVIDAGTIGEVRTLIADHLQLLPTDPQHRLQNPELGGGALLDLGIYPISFAYDLFGEPESELLDWAPTATGVDAHESIVLTYSGGRTASLVVGSDGRGPNRASVIGSDGYIELDPVWYTPTGFTVYAGKDGSVLERYERPDPHGRGMHYQAEELERLAEQGGGAVSELLPPDQTVAIMAVLDRLRERMGITYPQERAPGVPAD